MTEDEMVGHLTDSVDMGSDRLRYLVMDREAWPRWGSWGHLESNMTERLNNNNQHILTAFHTL